MMEITAMEARQIAERTNGLHFHLQESSITSLSDVEQEFLSVLKDINGACLRGEFECLYTPQTHEYMSVIRELKGLGFKIEYGVFPTIVVSW